MITIDSRELREMVEHRNIASLEALAMLIGVQLREELMDAGDFAFLDRNFNPVGVERCEVGNLMQKIRSGELETQLIRCVDSYTSVILLTEGVYDQLGGLLAHFKSGHNGNYFRTRIEPRFRYSELEAFKIRVSELGIELMWSPNFDTTLLLLQTLYKQRIKPEEAHGLFIKTRALKLPSKLTKNPAVPMLMALCPRLPEKVAILLLQRYETIWNVLHADKREILEIDGMGKGLRDRLYAGVGRVES
ncbi:MAG: ERCC4 domain-containing protein [bacterium]